MLCVLSVVDLVFTDFVEAVWLISISSIPIHCSSVESGQPSFPVLCAPALQFTTLKPMGDRLLVKVQEVEEKSAGGILLPSTAQTKPQGGQVVAVGEGRSVGDKKVPVDVPVSVCPSVTC